MESAVQGNPLMSDEILAFRHGWYLEEHREVIFAGPLIDLWCISTTSKAIDRGGEQKRDQYKGEKKD